MRVPYSTKWLGAHFFFYQFLTSSKVFIPQGYVPKTKITIQIPPEIVEGAW